MKTIISTLVIMLMAICSFGQATVNFDYDDAGNRIQRVILLPKENSVDSTLKAGDPVVFSAAEMQALAKTIIVGNTSITIWPNPSCGKFSVLLSNENKFTGAKYTIHDINGSKIIETSSRALLTHFDLADKPSGMYVLTIEIRGKLQTWKVLKQ